LALGGSLTILQGPRLILFDLHRFGPYGFAI
jgi:hypothetical protein